MKYKLIENNTKSYVTEGILSGKGLPLIPDSTNETTIEVIEGIKHIYGPTLPGGENQTIKRTNIKEFYTMIFTDGEIIYTGEKETYNVEELLTSKKINRQLCTKLLKFYNITDSINIYQVKVKNANYIIKVIAGEEFLRGTHSAGFYHVIQDKEVYLKNKSDKDTVKFVKEILKMLRENDINHTGFKYPKIDFEKKETNTKPIVKARKIK